MVGYGLAAAHHRLPHAFTFSGMVDNEAQDGAWLDGSWLRRDRLTPSMALLHYCYAWEVGEDAKAPAQDSWAAATRQKAQMERLPTLEAVRQRPVIDYFYWDKYRMPSDWPGGRRIAPHFLLSCNAPLLQEFHTTYAVPRVHDNRNFRRKAVFLRTYLPLLNEVLTVWKLDVLKCHVPTDDEEVQLEEAVQEGKDPFLYEAEEPFRHIVNLAPLLRIAVPKKSDDTKAYWVSKYVIEATSSDLAEVTFRNASEHRKAMFARLRVGQRPKKIPWPPQL
jgi:hypothetical protein